MRLLSKSLRSNPALNRVSVVRALFFLLAFAFIGVTIFRHFAFIGSITYNYPKGDQIIWVKNVLLPLEAGEVSLFEAATYEYNVMSHSHILQLLSMIANAKFFGLELKLDLYIGFFAVLMIFAVVFRYLRASVGHNLVGGFALAAISTILFSTGSFNLFAWTILMFQFVGIMIAVIYLYSFEKLSTGRGGKWALATLMVFLFGGPPGAAAIVASVGGGLYLSFLGRLKWKRFCLYFVFLCICIISLGVLFDGGRVHSRNSASSIFVYLFENPVVFSESLFKGLANSVIYERTQQPSDYFPYFISYHVGMGVALLGLGLAAFAAVRLFLHRQLNKPFVFFPVTMIITGAIIIVGTFRARYSGGASDVLLAPRYYTSFSILGVGLILFIALWASRVTSVWSKLASIVFCMIVCFFNFNSSNLGFKYRGAVIKSAQIKVDAMREHETRSFPEVQKLIGGPCRNELICRVVLNYLDDRNLSIYRNDPTENPSISDEVAN